MKYIDLTVSEKTENWTLESGIPPISAKNTLLVRIDKESYTTLIVKANKIPESEANRLIFNLDYYNNTCIMPLALDGINYLVLLGKDAKKILEEIGSAAAIIHAVRTAK